MKKTDWFPPEVKPVHAGVYEVRPDDWCDNWTAPWYSRWDGECWMMTCGSVLRADEVSEASRHNHKRFLEWRGLAEQPK